MRRRRACGIVLLGLAFLLSACSAQTASRTPRVKRRGTAADLQCARLPECTAYLDSIKRSVDRRWRPGARTSEGSVTLRMRIDGFGTPISVETVQADSPALAASCRAAVGYAEPFGPLPTSLAFLKEQEITIEFVYARPPAGP